MEIEITESDLMVKKLFPNIDADVESEGKGRVGVLICYIIIDTFFIGIYISVPIIASKCVNNNNIIIRS